MIYTPEDPTAFQFTRKHDYIFVGLIVLGVFIGGMIVSAFLVMSYDNVQSKVVENNHQHPMKSVRKITPTVKITPKVTKSSTKWGTATDQYLHQIFDKNASTALTIAKEHKLNCQSGKGTRYIGLFAIDIVAEGVSEKDMLDCYKNIDKAKQIFDREGFAPWGK